MSTKIVKTVKVQRGPAVTRRSTPKQQATPKRFETVSDEEVRRLTSRLSFEHPRVFEELAK